MEHCRNGKAFNAQLIPVKCGAKYTFFCAVSTPGLEFIGIVFPHPEKPHTHLPACGVKCPHTIREEYQQLVRDYGRTATVMQVEKCESSLF